MKPVVAIATLCLCPAALAQAPEVSWKPRTFRAGAVVYAAETGYLPVPENRAAEDSRTIRLAVVRLKSTADEPGPPLIFLPGGPGNSATSRVQSPAWSPLLELGDVILMDPRGTGRSQPDLMWRSDRVRPAWLFADRESAVEHMAEVAGAAAAHYRAAGVDLHGYNTIQMADDIDDLRRALGHPRVHLLGHSFGTHLGLAVIRRHPGTVARFVSVGTAGTGDMMKLPSDLDASLAQLAKVVAADPRVGEAMPDLGASITRVVAQLEDEPLPVPVTDPRTGETTEVPLGPFGLQLLLLADLGDTIDLPVFPLLLAGIEKRDPSIVRWFLQKRMQQFSVLPMMMLAVRGASGATDARWERIRREGRDSPFGVARCMFSPEADRAMDVGDVGDAFRAPVKSDVPTLFVSGTLDAHTPPAQAERVRRGLPNSGHLVVQFGGHEDLLPDRRVQERIAAFLGGAQPEDEVLERAPLRFAPLDGSDPKIRHPALAGR